MVSSTVAFRVVSGFRKAFSAFASDVDASDSSTNQEEALADAAVSLSEQLLSALTNGAVSNTTDAGSIVNEVVANDVGFSRAAVSQGWADVIEGFFEALNVSSPFNASTLMSSVLEVADNITEQANENLTSGVPNSLLVLPIVLLDEALEEVSHLKWEGDADGVFVQVASDTVNRLMLSIDRRKKISSLSVISSNGLMMKRRTSAAACTSVSGLRG